MYGLTEATVHCTYRPMTVADLDDPAVSPIGIPLPDLRILLLGPDGDPVADGQPGEMYVAGAGVARGYLNRPELTAGPFVSRPDLGEHRLYRTGDEALRRPDGELVHLGRLDGQLKVRGFRIEPGEIEHCLAEVPGLARAVVVPRDRGDGDVRLVACLVPGPGSGPDLTAVAERHVREQLPRHLRPSLYTIVTEVPLTVNGKVDRDALAR
ncbi:AMP-binding protein [Pseudonocardia sp. ICBG1142]|uniref:AMP-binding protein n=1 Tax=Pseudonocardia sp. ICBG1142 TaxID=2846760 RepID=UPI0021047AE9|nr:AMP-binding protein [Pseudonocardia sp. ICBG1142]